MAIPQFNNYYLTLALLAACTVVGIGVAVRFRREVDEDLAPPTAKDLLDPLEKAYYSGLMRPEEIERVRESVKKSQVAEVGAKPGGKATLKRSNSRASDDPWLLGGKDSGTGDSPSTPGDDENSSDSG